MKTPIVVRLFSAVLILSFVTGTLVAQVSPSPTPVPSPTPDLEKTKQLVENSTVTVAFSEADRASGATGFVIERDGKKYVATNIHVFEGQGRIEADALWTEGPATLKMGMRDASKARIKSSFPQFQAFSRAAKLPTFKARDGSAVVAKPIILMSAARDIALIEVQTEIPALKIQSPSVVSAGQDFLAVGNPEAEHTLIRLDGRFDGVGPDRLELNVLREKLKPGMSGGPVVNPATGEVIGIITYSVKKPEKRGDEIHDSDRGPVVVQRYEEVIRNFAYRMDNLNDLQPVDWPTFAVQCANIRAMKERTHNIRIAGYGLLKEWSGGIFNTGKLEGLEIPSDSDSSVSMAFNSLVRDLERLKGTDEVWKRWERYQRDLESLLIKDISNPAMQVTVPYLRRLVSETSDDSIATERRALAGNLRKESGKMNTSSGR